jgi:hypothetical protein
MELIANNNSELWRSISEYKNYEASSHGRIRNFETGRILKPKLDKDGYHQIQLSKNNTRKSFFVHRLVADAFIDNLDNKEQVDHIDHNRTNNCVNNLRYVSNQENQMNKSKQSKHASSKYKGVYYDKTSKKWRAYIMINRKTKHLGLFTDEKDAARAYNAKALELFGEYAYLNEIAEDEDEPETTPDDSDSNSDK